MSFFSITLGFHIAAGVVALASLSIPLITKKGSATHRRVGWVYVLAMAFVSASALLLCGARLGNQEPGDDVAALFLGQVGILTGHSVYSGIRALRRRRANDRFWRVLDHFAPSLLALSSLGLLVVALTRSSFLLLGFSALGLFNAATEFHYLLRGQYAPKASFFRHLSSMLASGIATVTAVLVVNATRLHLGTFNLALWLTPAALGILATALLTRKYRRRFLAPAKQLQELSAL